MVNSENLEYTACPLCHSSKHEKVYQFRPYAVVCCQSCGLYYLSPRLKETEMLKIYSNGNYFEGKEVGYSCYKAQEDALRSTFRRLMINLKERNLTGGSLLEIGCGYGYLLEEARGFFSPRAGTELSQHAVEEARRRSDHVYKGSVDSIPADDRFDCIIATHIIEHVYQPKEFLERLNKHLKPGGRMVIATPDMGSFWRHLMGSRWPSFKIPEHVLYFDRKSLYNLLQQTGLKKISTLPYPHAFPLSLIAAKLHIPLPSTMGKSSLWLPATTIAMYGVAPGE